MEKMKPILFSPLMVQAILEGRKTQTRRVIKPQPVHIAEPRVPFKTIDIDPKGIINRPYQLGDIIWVRETWTEMHGAYFYKADNNPASILMEPHGAKWRPSIHMPKVAARLFLKVTYVRVERLQDITEDDAIAEGFEGYPCDHIGRELSAVCGYGCTDCINTGWLEPPWVDFMFTWDKLNAKRGFGWETNPWVWVIRFERVEKP